ncbi:hypothetical protein LUZ60_001778 [Juncus effusus]|nr:hypothetical protein LUZ60_001778 [Juncus effusus]
MNHATPHPHLPLLPLSFFPTEKRERKKEIEQKIEIEKKKMPRPGPRPYECVRRAWHSDRHQPARASLIHHLFRMVNQVHSPSTLKNQEWQEKLPFVVLKAEEILYSKANSESEYMDVNTLWERANDAIDTIIRKDEASENGDLLYPCIEAALILGCVPRRASRSQRYNNPGSYLSPNEPLENNNISNSQHLILPIRNSTSNLNQSPVEILAKPNPSSIVYFRPPIVNRAENIMANKEEEYKKSSNSIKGFDCDLSLRLGIVRPNWFAGPGPLDNSCSEDLEDAGSTSSYA